MIRKRNSSKSSMKSETIINLQRSATYRIMMLSRGNSQFCCVETLRIIALYTSRFIAQCGV